MDTSRRDFLRTSALTGGAAAVGIVPAWVPAEGDAAGFSQFSNARGD